MKKKLLLILSALIALALLAWVFMPKATEVELATVSKGRFDHAVQADGKTRLRARYVVSTPLAGRVARLALKEGDAVQQGAVLTAVTPSAPALLDARTEDELRARIGAVTATSRRASVGVERASAALAQANNQLQRSETLAKQGFVSPNQNETERLTVRLREKELESAQQDVQASRYELAQAQAALKQYAQPAQASAQAPAQTSPTRAWAVRAPVSGKVLKVVQQSEDTLPAGAPLLELGDPTQLEVVVDILTADAVQVVPGMPVQMTAGSTVLAGRVRLIEPVAFTKVSALGVEEQRVNVIVDITSPPDKWPMLGDGFRVDVRILVQSVPDVTLVPVSALFPLANQHGVFVLDGGRARQKQVDITARNGVSGWVAKGLEPGAQVIVYPPSTLKEGSRVMARK
jgi:HlyD family secretion protein